MNRKKISRLIAGALATSVVLNSSPSAVESVNAITKDIYNEFSEEINDKCSPKGPDDILVLFGVGRFGAGRCLLQRL